MTTHHWTPQEDHTLRIIGELQLGKAEAIKAFPYYSATGIWRRAEELGIKLGFANRAPMAAFEPTEILSCLDCKLSTSFIIPAAHHKLVEKVKERGTCKCGSKRVIRS